MPTAYYLLLLLATSVLTQEIDYTNTFQSQTISLSANYSPTHSLNLEHLFKENVTLSYSVSSGADYCQITGGSLDHVPKLHSLLTNTTNNQLLGRIANTIYKFELQSNASERKLSIHSFLIHNNENLTVTDAGISSYDINTTDTQLQKVLIIESTIILFGYSDCIFLAELAGKLTYTLSYKLTDGIIRDVAVYQSEGIVALTDSEILAKSISTSVHNTSIKHSISPLFNLALPSEFSSAFQLIGCDDDQTFFLVSADMISVISLERNASGLSILSNITINDNIIQAAKAQRALVVLTETALQEYIIKDSCEDLALSTTILSQRLSISNFNSSRLIPGSNNDKYIGIYDSLSGLYIPYKHSIYNGNPWIQKFKLPAGLLTGVSYEKRINSLLVGIDATWLSKQGVVQSSFVYHQSTLYCDFQNKRINAAGFNGTVKVSGNGRFCIPTIYNFTNFTDVLKNNSMERYTDSVYYNPRKACQREAVITINLTHQAGVFSTTSGFINRTIVIIILAAALVAIILIVACALICRKLNGFRFFEDVNEENPLRLKPQLHYEVQEDTPSNASANASHILDVSNVGNGATSKSSSQTMRKYQQKKGLVIKIPKV